jgi:cellulose synthase/poly-beta-1,6-N-acetylglucosamine synthase-like glycosyltransferase/peptidoglycan/xylan/chitin deacetylase (PgdA/CDA1 family)
MSPRRTALPVDQSTRLRARIRRPPAHWTLVVLLLCMLLLLLIVQGVTTKTVGPSSVNLGSLLPNPPEAGQGPILMASGARLVSSGPPPGRRLALTFDDGPNPTWTPKILAVLRRNHVPATFFVIGSAVARYPGLLRQEHRLGFEIGNHTFTHTELSSIPLWQRRLQLRMTESAIAGAIGIRPRLMRPPYSATPLGLTQAQVDALLPLTRDGYLVTLANFVSEDWARPGVGSIIDNSTPSAGNGGAQSGGIVMMHDSGGNRAETVAALKVYIPRMLARGFRFVTVSDLAGLPRSVVELPANGSERVRGRLLLDGLLVSRAATAILNWAVVLVGVLVALRMLTVLLLARTHVRRRRRLPAPADHSPAVSILVPAYNEEVGIERAARSLAASAYPGEFDVIVIDDGSSDRSAEIVQGLALPNVRILRQANLGKAQALNRGIAASSREILVTVDADTVFEPETLGRLVAAFADPAVGAVSGNTKVGNRRRLIGKWQHIEYVMGFNLDRRAYEVLNCMPTVPGAIGAFRRQALLDSGGLSSATLAEDTDVTMAIGRHGWRVVYVDDAVAWTEAPETFGQLWRQRYRWAYGTIQSVWKHRAALRSAEKGKIGRRALPYLLVFQIVLPILAPVIDLFAIYGVLFLNPWAVAAYWLGFNTFQLVLAVYAFRLDGEALAPLWTLPLQQFVYRQLMYLVVIESIISAMLGTRLRWGHLERTGNVEVAS